MNEEYLEINWFSNLSISDKWSKWLWPEDEDVARLNDDLLVMYEQLIEQGFSENDWDSSINKLVNHIELYTPYEESEDAYYAPNHSVWQAAWVYNLYCVHSENEQLVPSCVSAQMFWFKKGFLPSSYKNNQSGESTDEYVVL